MYSGVPTTRPVMMTCLQVQPMSLESNKRVHTRRIEWMFNDLREGCAVQKRQGPLGGSLGYFITSTCLAWLLLCDWCRWWRGGWFLNCIFWCCWRGGLMGRRIWCVCSLCRWTNKEGAGHISAMVQHYIRPLIQHQRTRDSPIDSCTEEAQIAGNLGSLSGKHDCLSIEPSQIMKMQQREIILRGSREFLEIRISPNKNCHSSFLPCPSIGM